ncbi:MAG: DNA polymerase III subunit epsilon [Pseudomonadota bacterium]
MRQIVLDTETTGLSPGNGDRIVEIGCVELVDRRLTGNTYHQYINPERDMPEEAFNVHGLSNEFLSDKPVFAQIVHEFIDFIKGNELIIHNAPFDLGFLNNEINLLGSIKKSLAINRIEDCCGCIDSLKIAKDLRPGQKNNLDALCRSYGIDNSNRDLHGALLDSEILADVYLAMTGGQTAMMFTGSDQNSLANQHQIIRLADNREKIQIINAAEDEVLAHQAMMEMIEKKAGQVIWSKQLN